MKGQTVIVEVNSKVYVVTFDEYYTLDTVESCGKYLSTANSVVKKFLANQHKLITYQPISGVKYL